MAKRKGQTGRRSTPTTKTAFSVDAVKLHLSSLVQVDFGLAWDPKDGAFVLIQPVKVNQIDIPGTAAGTKESGSYHPSLGQYPAGEQLKIEWSVEPFNDLSGIAAFVRTSTTSAWRQLGPEKSPLGNKETWNGSSTYTVT